MPYVWDRGSTLWTREIVAVLRIHQPGVRSRVVLRDNSLYHTLTRARTMLRALQRDKALSTTRMKHAAHISREQ